MTLKSHLRQWMAEKRVVGFSPWRDADGACWGTIESVFDDRIIVRAIDPLGKVEADLKTYRFSRISYFDTDESYALRLKRLAVFTPTLPDVITYIKKRPQVKEVILEAAETGEPIHVQLRSESGGRSVRICSVDDGWVEFLNCDSLMQEEGREIWRLSTIEAVRWRTASEEADAFLLGLIS